MFRWIWCGLVVVVLCFGCEGKLEIKGGSPQDEVNSLQQAVIGGNVDLRYPAVGALIENQHIFCTGTLIASRIVLTAAHCLEGRKGTQTTFRIDLPSQSSAQGFASHFFDADTTNLEIHPGWTGNVADGNDVALFLLKTPVDPQIATPLPYNATPLDKSWEGKTALFLGFGLIQSVPTALAPDTKHGAAIPIVDMKSETFLTYDKDRSTCHGDSGGPALATVGGRFSVMGINSFSSSPIVPGSNPPRTRCDGRSGVARTDVHAAFIQSFLDRYGDPPGSCQSAADCSHCDICATSSTPNRCERRADLKKPTTCQPCRSDQDCGGELCHRFDEGFRCLQKCPSSGCCPAGTRCQLYKSGTTRDWFCVPDKEQCAPVACSSDADCGPGELCKAQQCSPTRPPRSAKLCLPCTQHADCAPKDATNPQDYLCLGPSGQGVCSQPCGDADFCPTGFVCSQPYRGAAKQCLPADGTCRLACQADADCPTDFACQNALCARTGGGKQGDFCDPMPCQKGLDCVETLFGKRCLKPCGTPLGEPGSRCLPNNQCNGTATCYTVDASLQVCIQPCTSDSQCNGGSCINRLCRCDTDADCAQNAFCNDGTGFFKSCLPKSLSGSCDAGFRCQPWSNSGKNYCVVGGSGSAAHGQACDGFLSCRTGLACVAGNDGSRCLEDCTKTRGCTLGGTCSAPRDGVAVCVCKADQCLSGRTCSAPFYLDEYGYCIGKSETPGCASSLECPPQTVCDAGKCAPAPPTPEVVEEPNPPSEPKVEPPTPEPPAPEPVKPDEPPVTTPEPVVDNNPTPDAGVKDTNPPTETSSDALTSEGCKCSTSNAPPSLGWMALLALFGLCLRRPKYPNIDSQRENEK